MSFNAIRENKVLAKISGFTVSKLALKSIRSRPEDASLVKKEKWCYLIGRCSRFFYMIYDLFIIMIKILIIKWITVYVLYLNTYEP